MGMSHGYGDARDKKDIYEKTDYFVDDTPQHV